MLGLRKRDSSQLSLVLDINSSSVGGGLLWHTGGKPDILHFHRQEFYNLSENNLEMLIALRSVLLKLFEARFSGKKNPASTPFDHVLVSLAAPFYQSKIIAHETKQEKPFIFDEWLVKETIKEEKEKFIKSIGENHTTFEAKVVSINLNGYDVTLPTTVETSSAEITLVFSAADKKLIHEIENEVIKIWGVRRGICFQSFPSLFLNAVYDTYPSMTSGTLVSMTGEVSEVLDISRKKLDKVRILSFGPTTLARALATELKISLPLAYSYLTLFARGDLVEEMSQKIELVLKKVDETWQKIWRENNELSNQPVILTGEDKYLPLVRALVEGVTEGRITIFSTGNKTFLPVPGGNKIRDTRIEIIGNISSSLLKLK